MAIEKYTCGNRMSADLVYKRLTRKGVKATEPEEVNGKWIVKAQVKGSKGEEAKEPEPKGEAQPEEPKDPSE